MDLDAYLTRIGNPARDLAAIQYAHATTIPFEDLDIHLGRPIRTDLPALEAKLVAGRRGGYCFEQNALLQAALESLGFDVVPLAARVRMVPDAPVGPRTHMLLLVDGAWIVDAGFGAAGPLTPIPFVEDRSVSRGVWTWRLVKDGAQWVAQLGQRDGWLDLYAFTEERQYPADLEVANHYTSTHPSSPFVRLITAQLPGDEMQLVLRGGEINEYRPDGMTRIEIADDDELLRVLAERFGLDFPAGTRFRSPLA